MRLDQNDGMAMLRKIQSICVPCTPQDLNNIQMRLWNLKMKEDETAIKFLFRFRKFQEQLVIHNIKIKEDALVDHLINIIHHKPGKNRYKILTINLQQQRRLKQQVTLEDLEECFQDFDAQYVQPKGDQNKN